MLCNKMGPNSASTTCTSMTAKMSFPVTKSVSFLTPSQLHRYSEPWFTVQSNYYCNIPRLSSRTLLLRFSDGGAPLPDVCSCALTRVTHHGFHSLLRATKGDSLKPASVVFLPTSPGWPCGIAQAGRSPVYSSLASSYLQVDPGTASHSFAIDLSQGDTSNLITSCYRERGEMRGKFRWILASQKGEQKELSEARQE